MTVLLIGEAPGPAGDGLPLEGPVGRRLADWAGVPWEAYLELTERHNLYASDPGPWSAEDARRHAQSVFPQLVGRRTILLGRRVADAFGIREGPFRWIRVGPTSVAVVPHPSGRNRYWNDPAHVDLARSFLREALAEEAR